MGEQQLKTALNLKFTSIRCPVPARHDSEKLQFQQDQAHEGRPSPSVRWAGERTREGDQQNERY